MNNDYILDLKVQKSILIYEKLMKDLGAFNLLNEGKAEDIIAAARKASDLTDPIIKVLKGQAASSIDDEEKLVARLIRGLEKEHPLKSFLRDTSFTAEQKADVISKYLSTEKASTRSKILSHPEDYIPSLAKQTKLAFTFSKEAFNKAYSDISRRLAILLPEPLPQELIKFQEDILDAIKSMPLGEKEPRKFITDKLTGGLNKKGKWLSPYDSVKDMSREELERNLNKVIENNKRNFRKLGLIINEIGPLSKLKELYKKGAAGVSELVWAFLKWLFDAWFLSGTFAYKRGEISGKFYALRTLPFWWNISEDARIAMVEWAKGFFDFGKEIETDAKNAVVETPTLGAKVSNFEAISMLYDAYISHTTAAGLLGSLGAAVTRAITGTKEAEKQKEKFRKSGRATREKADQKIEKSEKAVKDIATSTKQSVEKKAERATGEITGKPPTSGQGVEKPSDGKAP
jgi:hypothetical protein